VKRSYIVVFQAAEEKRQRWEIGEVGLRFPRTLQVRDAIEFPGPDESSGNPSNALTANLLGVGQIGGGARQVGSLLSLEAKQRAEPTKKPRRRVSTRAWVSVSMSISLLADRSVDL
jgi:hypothetical protein